MAAGDAGFYEVVVETSFTAAHRHDGTLHGHDFKVLITVAATSLADDVVVDFHALKHAADERLKRLSHSTLNDHEELGGVGPVAVARWLYGELQPALPRIPGAPDRRLLKIEVWDTERSAGSYTSG